MIRIRSTNYRRVVNPYLAGVLLYVIWHLCLTNHSDVKTKTEGILITERGAPEPYHNKMRSSWSDNRLQIDTHSVADTSNEEGHHTNRIQEVQIMPSNAVPVEKATVKKNREFNKKLGTKVNTVRPAGPSCQTIRLSNKKLPMVALATAPGSGTTWARHLFQQLTGIYGSTIYAEKKMPSEEFPHDQLFNGSAIPIKTHKRADEHYDKQKLFFSKGILIVRDPFDAIRANFNRRVAGSTAVVTEETFDQKNWLEFVQRQSTKWIQQIVSWSISDKPIFLIRYDSMKANMTYLRHTFKEAVKFIGLTTSDAMLDCTLTNLEGAFHRIRDENKTAILSFPQTLADTLHSYINITEWYLERRCPQPPWCLHRSKVSFSEAPYVLPST